uniref:Uncharacterized protein n=1 Tax=Opuntia streptacantha TaxID=393608 RepID=A0A7C9ELT6_OPUST
MLVVIFMPPMFLSNPPPKFPFIPKFRFGFSFLPALPFPTLPFFPLLATFTDCCCCCCLSKFRLNPFCLSLSCSSCASSSKRSSSSSEPREENLIRLLFCFCCCCPLLFCWVPSFM